MSESTNPLLSKIKLPGRTFQLPSRGALYQNGELAPNVTEGEVHVHPMTALAEINLKNPDQLFNGKALEAVVAECIPSIKKPLELFNGDVDALLFFLRITTYGSEYRVEVKHDCENAKDHSYVVDLEQIMQGMKQLDPTLVETKRIVHLPDGTKVYTRPTRFSDVIQLFHRAEGKKELSAEDIQQIAVQNLMFMIQQVDEVTDRKLIEEWVRTLTTPMVNKISASSAILNDWGPDQVVTLKCKDCGADMRVELPLNPVSFFTE